MFTSGSTVGFYPVVTGCCPVELMDSDCCLVCCVPAVCVGSSVDVVVMFTGGSSVVFAGKAWEIYLV